MKMKQFLTLFIVLFCACNFNCFAQNHQYYVRAISHDFEPKLEHNGTSLIYKGRDEVLKDLFDTNTIYVFEKAFTNSSKSNLQRTFYVETDSSNSLDEFIVEAASFFDYGEYLGNFTAELAYHYPNDYGLTSPVTNLGLPVYLHYLDYINAAMAWDDDYTTGSSDIKIGISDGGPLFVNNLEFIGKNEILPNATNSTNPSVIGHGNGVAGIAAARGDNGHDITGVCYDCNIMMNGYGNFNRILELANAGADIINCSWGVHRTTPSPTEQECIDEIAASGTVIVAASFNLRSNSNGEVYNYDYLYYPASYNNVISVAAVAHINDLICDNIEIVGGIPIIRSPKDYVGAKVTFFNNAYDCTQPLEDQVEIYRKSTTILNNKVDILAPSGGMFSYGSYLVTGVISYQGDTGLATSNATPQVSGTVGLMKSLNNCLSFNEVESILKISSKYIGDIPANQHSYYNNKFGSGGLNTGKAVALTDALMNEYGSVAYLEDQKFSRWDFVFNGVSENIVMRNQEFKDTSTVTVTAKNVITLEEGTLLEPGSSFTNPPMDGFALFEIDPSLVISCPPTTLRQNRNPDKDTEVGLAEQLFVIYPTIVESEISITKEERTGDRIEEVKVYNMLGIEVYGFENLNHYHLTFDLSQLSTGIYIVKGLSTDNKVLFTNKIIKK